VKVDKFYHIRRLIEEVLVVCKNDDTWVTVDLLEPAKNAATEIGMTSEEIKELLGESIEA